MSVNPLYDFRNERQKMSFNDIVDIYHGALSTVASGDGFIKGKGVPTLLYQGVPCMLNQTDYATQPTEIGRAYTANLLTNDEIYFCSAQPLEDANFFVLRTPGHPQAGQWWAFQSDPRLYPDRGDRHTNYAACKVKATTDPTTVPSNSSVA